MRREKEFKVFLLWRERIYVFHTSRHRAHCMITGVWSTTRPSRAVLGYSTGCDKRLPILSPSIEGGGSDPYFHRRYSANGPPIESRHAIVLYLFTMHPSSSESFSASGPLSPTV